METTELEEETGQPLYNSTVAQFFLFFLRMNQKPTQNTSVKVFVLLPLTTGLLGMGQPSRSTSLRKGSKCILAVLIL